MSRHAGHWLALSGLLLALATGLGAWASHGLEGMLSAGALGNFELAVTYQFYHALGLLGTAVLLDRCPTEPCFTAAAISLSCGILLFCGSLYLTAFDLLPALVHAAPVGGLAFIAGWLLLAGGAIRCRLPG